MFVVFGCQLEQEQGAMNHKAVIFCTTYLPKFFNIKSLRCMLGSCFLIFKRNQKNSILVPFQFVSFLSSQPFCWFA